MPTARPRAQPGEITASSETSPGQAAGHQAPSPQWQRNQTELRSPAEMKIFSQEKFRRISCLSRQDLLSPGGLCSLLCPPTALDFLGGIPGCPGQREGREPGPRRPLQVAPCDRRSTQKAVPPACIFLTTEGLGGPPGPCASDMAAAWAGPCGRWVCALFCLGRPCPAQTALPVPAKGLGLQLGLALGWPCDTGRLDASAERVLAALCVWRPVHVQPGEARNVLEAPSRVSGADDMLAGSTR